MSIADIRPFDHECLRDHADRIAISGNDFLLKEVELLDCIALRLHSFLNRLIARFVGCRKDLFAVARESAESLSFIFGEFNQGVRELLF